MKILFVNHTARISGAEHSLISLLGGLELGYEAVTACPAGPLADAVRDGGGAVRELPGTEGSLKLHPVHSTRALVEMGRASIAVRRIAAEERADIVHANSIRAGLVATLASRIGAPPAVVHVRDCLPPGRISTLTTRAVASADCLIANSRYTAEHVRRMSPRARLRVVHNPIDLDRFDAERFDRGEARRRLGIAPEALVLGLVAQITPWKGQVEAVQATAKAVAAHPDLRLLLVGSPKFTAKATRHDNLAYLRQLEEVVVSLGMGDRVLFLGEREDVPEVLAAADVALAPSWQEPFGRSIAEAMAMGLPVIATSEGGPKELITHGHDGLLVAPRRPELWADAISGLAVDAEARQGIGIRARATAVARFGVAPHVEGVLQAYREVLGASTATTPKEIHAVR